MVARGKNRVLKTLIDSSQTAAVAHDVVCLSVCLCLCLSRRGAANRHLEASLQTLQYSCGVLGLWRFLHGVRPYRPEAPPRCMSP